MRFCIRLDKPQFRETVDSDVLLRPAAAAGRCTDGALNAYHDHDPARHLRMLLAAAAWQSYGPAGTRHEQGRADLA